MYNDDEEINEYDDEEADESGSESEAEDDAESEPEAERDEEKSEDAPAPLDGLVGESLLRISARALAEASALVGATVIPDLKPKVAYDKGDLGLLVTRPLDMNLSHWEGYKLLFASYSNHRGIATYDPPRAHLIEFLVETMGSVIDRGEADLGWDVEYRNWLVESFEDEPGGMPAKLKAQVKNFDAAQPKPKPEPEPELSADQIIESEAKRAYYDYRFSGVTLDECMQEARIAGIKHSDASGAVLRMKTRKHLQAFTRKEYDERKRIAGRVLENFSYDSPHKIKIYGVGTPESESGCFSNIQLKSRGWTAKAISAFLEVDHFAPSRWNTNRPARFYRAAEVVAIEEQYGGAPRFRAPKSGGGRRDIPTTLKMNEHLPPFTWDHDWSFDEIRLECGEDRAQYARRAISRTGAPFDALANTLYELGLRDPWVPVRMSFGGGTLRVLIKCFMPSPLRPFLPAPFWLPCPQCKQPSKGHGDEGRESTWAEGGIPLLDWGDHLLQAEVGASSVVLEKTVPNIALHAVIRGVLPRVKCRSCGILKAEPFAVLEWTYRNWQRYGFKRNLL